MLLHVIITAHGDVKTTCRRFFLALFVFMEQNRFSTFYCCQYQWLCKEIPFFLGFLLSSNIKLTLLAFIVSHRTKIFPPGYRGITWTYIRRSDDVQKTFRTFNLRPMSRGSISFLKILCINFFMMEVSII